MPLQVALDIPNEHRNPHRALLVLHDWQPQGDEGEDVLDLRHSAAITMMLLWIGLMASGCSTPVWTSPPGSERYRIDYKDGCDAGFAIAGSFFYARIDSAEPADDDADYLAGWQDGFDGCRRRQNRVQATLHSIFGVGH